jgi:hypothetical protein
MSIDDSVRDPGTTQDLLRSRAVKTLKKRRDFKGHLLVYTMVNTFLVLVWLVTSGPDGFFWPVFPIVGWGIVGRPQPAASRSCSLSASTCRAPVQVPPTDTRTASRPCTRVWVR